MRDSNITKVKKYATEVCKYIESLPPYVGGTVDERRKQRYPFERGIENYLNKLPDLGGILDRLSTGTKVLDIGTGTGIALSQIGQRWGCDIYGTGLQRIKNITFPYIATAASHLPFSDNTFDVVVSVQGIAWEPDQIRALQEVERILRPDGMGLIYTFSFSHCMELWYGENFWTECGVSLKAYQRYEFSPKKYHNYPNYKISRVPIADIYKDYTHAYYIQVKKSLGGLNY